MLNVNIIHYKVVPCIMDATVFEFNSTCKHKVAKVCFDFDRDIE